MKRIVVLSLAVALPTVALAQPYYAYPPQSYGDPLSDFFTPQPLSPRDSYRGVYPNPYYRGGRRAFGDPAPYCQKLCLQDFAPCDPPEYKRADGRCTNPTYRF